ncbi:MAG: hypothetical protein J2P21_00855 [Chloracidobacterium sp.]|nr:hypothetical protein [Chloracidobacterium sp.]
MKARASERAMAHAESCAQCAARLDHERRMMAGLYELATDEKAINAPERVGSALRAAFDQRRAGAASPAILPGFPRHKPLWRMTAAAVLTISVGVLALWPRGQKPSFGARPADVVNRPTPQSRRFESQKAPPVKLVEAPGAREIFPSTAARPGAKSVRRRKPSIKESDGAGQLFPLTFVARSGPAEFVRTVRIEISRSTLMSMGVPVNIDRGEGLIKADVIIGEDGVARAMRLIN